MREVAALSRRALGRFRSDVASGGDFLMEECIELFLCRASCSRTRNQCVRLGHAPHGSTARHRNHMSIRRTMATQEARVTFRTQILFLLIANPEAGQEEFL
jgi:hypothetical protein